MNFPEAISHVLSNLVNFKGRARRSEYWYWTLLVCLVDAALNILQETLGVGGVISTLISFLLILCSLSVMWRRMHDIGKSGWVIVKWMIIPYFAGMILALLGFALNSNVICIALGMILEFVCVVMSIVIGIVWAAKDSMPGENEYGPNPKGVNGTPSFSSQMNTIPNSRYAADNREPYYGQDAPQNGGANPYNYYNGTPGNRVSDVNNGMGTAAGLAMGTVLLNGMQDHSADNSVNMDEDLTGSAADAAGEPTPDQLADLGDAFDAAADQPGFDLNDAQDAVSDVFDSFDSFDDGGFDD